MSRLIGFISGSFEEVLALDWIEEVADFAESVGYGMECSGGFLAQQRLELGEGHLYGVEIG